MPALYFLSPIKNVRVLIPESMSMICDEQAFSGTCSNSSRIRNSTARGCERLDMSAWWSASVCSRVMPPNKAPEATRVRHFLLFIKGFWLLGIAGRGCLSFFRSASAASSSVRRRAGGGVWLCHSLHTLGCRSRIHGHSICG